MRKPRPDSVLKTAPEGIQEAIIAYMRDHTLEATRKHIEKEYNLPTSTRGLSEFWEWWHISRSVEQAKIFSDRFQADLAARPDLNLDPDKLRQLGQVVFEMEALKARDAQTFIAMQKLSLDVRKGDLAERELALARDRFEFDAAAAALKHVETLKSIAMDASLNADDKINAARRRLFSDLPEDEA